jgi:hypothetical protein
MISHVGIVPLRDRVNTPLAYGFNSSSILIQQQQQEYFQIQVKYKQTVDLIP